MARSGILPGIRQVLRSFCERCSSRKLTLAIDELQFLTGKKQLAYYCRSLGLSTGIYLVFCPNNIHYPDVVKEVVETIEGTEVRTYLVEYDEEKWE